MGRDARAVHPQQLGLPLQDAHLGDQSRVKGLRDSIVVPQLLGISQAIAKLVVIELPGITGPISSRMLIRRMTDDKESTNSPLVFKASVASSSFGGLSKNSKCFLRNVSPRSSRRMASARPCVTSFLSHILSAGRRLGGRRTLLARSTASWSDCRLPTTSCIAAGR